MPSGGDARDMGCAWERSQVAPDRRHDRAFPRCQGGRIGRTLLAGLVAAALAAWATWLNWRPPVEPLPAAALPLAASGRVVSVEDGDTFVFDAEQSAPPAPRRLRVRLHAIDAPELLQDDGIGARAALDALTRGRRVRIDCYKRDAHGRAVCRAHAVDAGAADADIELALLQQGRAWHYRAFASEQTAAERRQYEAAEAAARAARRGLWQRDMPVPPWTCRERLRAAQTCD